MNVRTVHSLQAVYLPLWWFSIEKKSFSDLVEMVKKNLRTIGKKEPVANSAELDDESPADSKSQDQ